MTSEAPKEVWTGACGKALVTDGMKRWGGDVRYIRADHALAMVAAAYEDAADTCFNPKWKPKCSTDWVQARTAGTIRARTPADERAALDALLRAERVKALREAAGEIGNLHCMASTPQLRLAMSALTETGMDAILALIEKETGQ